MKRLSIFIFSILPLVAVAQEDSLQANVFAMEFAIDYGKILTLPTAIETKFEGAVDLKFNNKYEVLFELGYASLSPENAIKNGSYNSKGLYYRGGLLYCGEILPKSFLGAGAMYGISNFDDQGTVLVESTIWEDYNSSFMRKGLTGSWFEIIITTEQQLRNNLALGAKFRWRKLLSYSSEFEPEAIAIPGYGQTINQSVPAVNLYIKYRFDF